MTGSQNLGDRQLVDEELGWESFRAFPVCVNIFLRKSWLPLCVGTALLRSCCKPFFEPRLAGSCVCGLLHLCVNIVSPELHQGVRNVWWGFESSCPNCFSEWCWPNQNGGGGMGKMVGHGIERVQKSNEKWPPDFDWWPFSLDF